VLVELARAVRERRVSPVELVEESLRRIDRLGPPINAVVRVHADEALAAARAMADGDDAGRSGPLAGLPLLVKDMARCAGSVTTFGSPLFADAPPDTVDDATVGKLRAAGAIVVGRTNTPAFGHTAFTDNRVFGPTRNPWNLTRSPAGSSGGSAAALIAGLAPLATTSDGGGSTRGPASACGLVGYKPTNGAYGRNVLPRWIAFSTMGSAGRTVADVAQEVAVSIGGVPGDVLSFPRGTVDLTWRRPARVVAVPGYRGGMAAVVAEAFERTCATIERAVGIPVERVEQVFSGDTATAWFTISSAELAQSLADVRDQWAEFEPTLQFACDYGAAVTAFDYVAAQRARFTAAAELDALLGDDTVLVVPTFNSESWPAEGPLPLAAGPVTGPGVAFNTTEGNFTGHPAISVPMGYDTAGVPLGVQVVAPRFADGLAFGLAAALEEAMPWATVAPGYDPWHVP
jgi:Asp-tRNA(Asn)/Glu-tRNA(Gln) amidotransferase A subunit family amidase